MKNLGNIEWSKVKRYASPEGVKELDRFLDTLPLHVGTNALAAVGIAWLVAGLAVVITTMEMEKVSKLRAELAKVESLKPPIPTVEYAAPPEAELKDLQAMITGTYKGLSFSGGAGALTISAQDTDYFPQFLAAIHTLQNGGRNWRTEITAMCAGRDCPTSKLSATLKIEVARVAAPPADAMTN